MRLVGTEAFHRLEQQMREMRHTLMRPPDRRRRLRPIAPGKVTTSFAPLGRVLFWELFFALSFSTPTEVGSPLRKTDDAAPRVRDSYSRRKGSLTASLGALFHQPDYRTTGIHAISRSCAGKPGLFGDWHALCNFLQ